MHDPCDSPQADREMENSTVLLNRYMLRGDVSGMCACIVCFNRSLQMMTLMTKLVSDVGWGLIGSDYVCCNGVTKIARAVMLISVGSCGGRGF